MRPQPLQPKKSKFIYTALLCSLLLHLGLVAAPMLRPPAPEPEALQPVRITLNEYQLAPAPKPVEPKPPVSAPPVQTKPAVISNKAKAPIQTKPAEATAETSDVNTDPSAQTDDAATAEPDQNSHDDTSAQSSASNDAAGTEQTTPEPDDTATAEADAAAEAQALAEAEAAAQKAKKTSSGPKLSEQDIANNGNVIQPKAGTQPSFPSNAQLRYEGPAGVTGYMSFQRGGGRYSLTTTFNIPFYKMSFESTGLVEGKYFKPLRYTDKRKGKIYAQAIFDYDQQQIHYGKGAEPDQVEPLTHHAQDFFTLAWQMALNGGKLSEPMQVTNGKKVYLHSDFSPKGDRQYDSNEGKINVQVFRINRGEDGIEFAFAPDFANIPAQIILTDGGKTHQLRLIGITLDGVDYWQAIRRTRDK